MTANDLETFAGLLAPDVSFIHANGMLDNRDTLLEKLRTGVILYRRVAVKVKAAKAIGPNALLIRGTLELDANVGGVERQMKSIYIVVWVRGGDGWRLVSHQTTLLPA